MQFSVPSVCADQIELGQADIGIVPSAELDRLGLEFLPDVGIACRGAVRSILLISKLAPQAIRTLAVDVSSRTSIMLGRIILAERYGSTPRILPMTPVLDSMLDSADAALIIGDPALRLDPHSLHYQVLDLGAEWFSLTKLPMVFAVWAGHASCITDEIRPAFSGSCRYGLSHIEAIVADSEASHSFPQEVVREYLTRYIQYQLGPDELRGLSHFRQLVSALRARDLELVSAS